MNPFPGIHSATKFTHQTWDRIVHIAAFSDSDAVEIGGERGVALGTISLQPARAASVTGEQLTLLLRLYPKRVESATQLLSKGMDQYSLFQQDAEHLAFEITTKCTHTLTVALPGDWYDQWHTVAAVYTGKNLQLIIDGTLLGEAPASGEIRYAPGALLLGKHAFRETTGAGIVAALQLYDTPRTPDTLGHAWEEPTEGCLLDLRFDDLTLFESPSDKTTTEPSHPPTATAWQEALNAWQADDAMLLSGALTWKTPPDTDWQDVMIDWEVSADGNTLSSGTCPFDWNSEDHTAQVRPDYPMPDPGPGTVYWLTLYFIKKSGSDSAPIGWKQFRLPIGQPSLPGPLVSSFPPVEISEKDNTGFFQGENFAIAIDFPTATITSWKIDDEELLELGPIHQLWRAPTWQEVAPRNDGEGIALLWSRAGLAENIMGVTAMEAVQDTPARVCLRFKGLIIRRNSDVLFEIEREYAIHGNGEVVLTQTLLPKTSLPALGRLGLELRIPKDMREVTWFGKGPNALSKSSQPWDILGRYQANVEDTIPTMDWPCECGHKSNTQWLTMRNKAGRGLYLGSDTPFTATVSPYSTFQLSEALHGDTLTPDSAFTLHIDHTLSYSDDDATNGEGGPTEPVTTQLRMRALLPEDQAPWVYLKVGTPRENEDG
ncbi:MAG: hypothetical protein L3K26_10490 [Candidatus Hydrogenedentes bacterium]|nr:hypothetical protein [Candidatus Hydrogenedentota bacterium]